MREVMGVLKDFIEEVTGPPREGYYVLVDRQAPLWARFLVTVMALWSLDRRAPLGRRAAVRMDTRHDAEVLMVAAGEIPGVVEVAGPYHWDGRGAPPWGENR